MELYLDDQIEFEKLAEVIGRQDAEDLIQYGVDELTDSSSDPND